MRLLITQKNDIFDILFNEGFNPDEFYFSEELHSNNEIVTYLRFQSSKYYFAFRNLSIFFASEFSPGQNSLVEEDDKISTWRQLLIKLKKWLKYLKRETIVIDKWERYSKDIEKFPFTINYKKDSQSFSSEEIKLISLNISLIKNKINSLNLPEATINTINEKLDKLDDKTSKLSKTDWKELFIGSLLGLIINLSVPQELSKEIWKIIQTTFNQYLLK